MYSSWFEIKYLHHHHQGVTYVVAYVAHALNLDQSDSQSSAHRYVALLSGDACSYLFQRRQAGLQPNETKCAVTRILKRAWKWG